MKGLAFHLHHGELVEWCHDYQERVDYIKKYKHPDEQELRLRLFQIIPEDRTLRALQRALVAYDETVSVYFEARRAYSRANIAYKRLPFHTRISFVRFLFPKGSDARRKATDACNNTRTTVDKTLCALDRAYVHSRQVLKDNLPELEALHAELCPGCPWDGETIFPKGES